MSEAALSVGRIAALLELFERERRSLTNQEIVQHLDIPRSSLGTFLKALVDGRLRDGVLRLCQQTGETVSLSAVGDLDLDLDLEVILVDSQDVGVQLVVQPGRRMPLWTSAVGTACLATLTDATVRSMRAHPASRRTRRRSKRR